MTLTALMDALRDSPAFQHKQDIAPMLRDLDNRLVHKDLYGKKRYHAFLSYNAISGNDQKETLKSIHNAVCSGGSARSAFACSIICETLQYYL